MLELVGLIRENLEKSQSLLVLDYDGTIIPLYKTIEEGVLPPFSKQLFARLQKRYPRTSFAILSGRPLGFLQEQFRDLEFHLFAEHSAEYGLSSSIERIQFSSDRMLDFSFYNAILAEWQSLVQQYRGTYLEFKKFSLGFHYDSLLFPDALKSDLERIHNKYRDVLNSVDYEIFWSVEVIELRSMRNHKSMFIQKLSQVIPQRPQVIVAAGDDANDESMFATLNPHDISIKIGHRSHDSKSRFELKNQADFLSILTKLSD